MFNPRSLNFRRYHKIKEPKECMKCFYTVPMKNGKSVRKSCKIHYVKGGGKCCEHCGNIYNEQCYHVEQKEECCVIS